MRKILRALKWSILGSGLLLALIVVAGLIYTRTENFNGWVREQALAAINDSIRGSITVARLEGSVWRRLILLNVALRYEEVEIARIPRVEVAFSLIPLFRGRLEISQIDALTPKADLRQDREGRWNVVEALAPRSAEPEESSAFTTVVRSLRLRDGAMDLRVVGESEKLYRARNLNLEGGLGLLAEGVSLEVRKLASALTSEDFPDLNLKGGLEYRQIAGAPPALKVNDLWAVSRHSQVKLDGEVVQGAALQVKARARVDRLAPADIGYFLADWPLRRDIAGDLTVEGPLADLEGVFSLGGAGAKLTGTFRADVSQSAPRYRASMTINGFDLGQWLATKDFAGVVAGTVEARGSGFALNDIAAKTRFEVRSTQVQGWALGTLAMEARLEKSTAVLDGRLDGKAGGASWSGEIGLQGKRPTYEAALAVKNLDVARVAGNHHAALQGRLNFQGTLQGAGLALAEMHTRADLRVLPSSLGPVNVTDGHIDAALRGGRLSITRAALRTADSMVAVNGDIGLDRASTGKLSYQLQSTDIKPWLALLNQQGTGSLKLSGQASGNLSQLETRGTVRLARVKVAGIAATSGDVDFSLRGAPTEFFPEGVVTLRIADFDAGLLLRRLDGKATFARAPVETIELNLRALDAADRKHALNGALTLAPEGPSLRLSQLSLSAPDGTWRLSQPAELSQRGEAFLVEQLSLRNGDRAVILDGRVGFAGKQDLRLELDRLPLETLAEFLPNPPRMTGLIEARAHIGGSAAAPEITANLKLANPTIAGQSYAGAHAEAAYMGKRATVRLVLQQDASHSLTADGVVPLTLSWQDQWRAEAGDGMEFRARSSGLSLGFLNVFAGKAAENIAGEFALDVIARGSLKQPDLRGTFSLRDGRVRLVPAGVDITGITLAGDLDSRNLVLRELSARAKDGEIHASGSIALKNYALGAAKVSLNAKRWPAIDTSRYQIRVGGNLDIQGTLDAPVIKGRLQVAEGSLRPDLEFLEQSKAPVKRDETITIVRNGKPIAPTAAKDGAPTGGQSEIFENFVLDVAVRAPRNLWIRHPDLQTELSGNVRVAKAKQRDIELTGRIEIVRGWFALQGRRFQLNQGQIEFTGGDTINPSLNIVAQYKLPDYQVDATIGGTAEKPSLTLSSQPRLEQADILALLLFGRPLDTLNQAEQGSLQQSAMNLTSGYVAGRIANSVSAALGLDNLGIDIRQVDFGGGRVGFGRYVGGKTYVSFSQELSGERGQGVALEYQVARDWKIGTSTTSTGSNGIDVIWHKRY